MPVSALPLMIFSMIFDSRMAARSDPSPDHGSVPWLECHKTRLVRPVLRLQRPDEVYHFNGALRAVRALVAGLGVRL